VVGLIGAFGALVWLMRPLPPLTPSEVAGRLGGATVQRVERRHGPGGVLYCVYLGPEGFLPSGPRVCVVDASGAVLAQTDDVGDDPDFADRWLTGVAVPATVGEVRGVLEGAAGRGATTPSP
jgi:hypothetical protein